ncbi:MATE family efflux transporter [Epilithonimonas sp.]|uniref:MATE family efflux transporter n=1 Tax=Epilithonimonas sp. TaxID=2894511 RepID=UPI0028980429|nr:MATE family efflux transporter [Epilithonimonas sp.]
MSSTKNIAKNSLILYFRMFINMGVGLFTAGIVLNTLGITDYGIYNVVGGFVSMFGFLNASMSSATQRFLSFDLGKNDFEQLRKTFSTTVTIHFAIAILIVLVLETFGLWYINYKLNVPSERMMAVNIVFQFSVVSSFLGIVQVPYNALITAHERFNVYAYISFLEIAFKLAILYFLVCVQHDKLVLYSTLLFVSSFVIRMVYRIYSRRNFPESNYEFYFDKSYFKEILSFTGWNIFGNVATVARGQGNNMLLNLFFGPVLNAAYGVSTQFQGVINSFVSNFQVAVNPQIIKTYANREFEKSIFLMKESSKLSYFLMLIMSVPMVYNIDYILEIWIKKVPPYTNTFICISLVGVLLDAISNPLMTAARASGKIKWYQIIISITIFLSLPLSYFALKIYKNPNLIFIIISILNFGALVFRIYFLQNMISLNVKDFIKDVFIKILVCTTIVFLANYTLYYYYGAANTIISLIIFGIINVISTSLVIVLFGINKHEKKFIKNYFNLKFIKK